LVTFGGTVSGFHLGDDIDLRGLAFTSGKDALSWTQITSRANANGTPNVTSGSNVETLTLLGQSNLSASIPTSPTPRAAAVKDGPLGPSPEAKPPRPEGSCARVWTGNRCWRSRRADAGRTLGTMQGTE
jgi:hypothetical protein